MIANVKRNCRKGFTIIEIMVASSLGIFMLWAMTKLYLDNRITSIAQNDVVKVSSDAGLTFSLIENDAQNAGYRGCVSGNVGPQTGNGSQFYNVTTSGSNYFNSLIFIQGNSGTGASFVPTPDSAVLALSPPPNPNMDVLTLRMADNPGVLTSDMLSSTSPIPASNSASFSPGSVMLLSNCAASSLLDVASVSGGNVVATSQVGATYLTGSQSFVYDTVTYYVGTDDVLYRSVNGAASEPIAQNIDQFSVLYGVNTNSSTTDVGEYLTASAAPDFTKTLAIRIGLVIKANDGNTVTSPNYSYIFNGKTIVPGDGKFRKLFYTTIALRNMLP